MFDDLVGIFGSDLFLEVMPHGFPDQVDANLAMVQLAQSANVPLVATNDAHYALAEHWRLHEALLAMQTHATRNDPKRWTFPGGPDYYLKSREEMEASFSEHHPGMSPEVVRGALDNTEALADMCRVEVVADTKRCLLPRVEVAEGSAGIATR